MGKACRPGHSSVLLWPITLSPEAVRPQRDEHTGNEALLSMGFPPYSVHIKTLPHPGLNPSHCLLSRLSVKWYVQLSVFLFVRLCV